MAEHPAAYAHRVNKVVIHGTCFAGTEEWSTGFFMGSATADAADPGSTTAAAIAPFWTTFFQAATSRIATTYKTDSIKVSQLETDGDVDLDMIDIYDYPSAIAGVQSGAVFPPQITLAATLTSDFQRGLAAKGRMYLPGVQAVVNTGTGKISTTDAAGIATNLKTFFDAVNGSIDIPGTVILASKGRKLNGPGPGEYSYIGGRSASVTGLRVGDVFDTQRRRRGDLAEAYSAVVLA